MYDIIDNIPPGLMSRGKPQIDYGFSKLVKVNQGFVVPVGEQGSELIGKERTTTAIQNAMTRYNQSNKHQKLSASRVKGQSVTINGTTYDPGSVIVRKIK